MAYINYDPDSNFYDVVRGVFSDSREFHEHEMDSDISFLMEGQSVSGVRVRKVFDKNEVLGAKGEEYVKDFMDRNGVPCLYVGQGPTGVQKSKVLRSKLQAHRPDFLIHLPNLGTLFFDVKCRWPHGFNEKGEACFYLFKNEMESLIRLHFELFIPVWITFIDSNAFNRMNAKPVMHMVCASLINDYWQELKKHLSTHEIRALGVIRIPMALLWEIKDKLEFQIGVREIPMELAIRYATLHSGLVRRVQDEIRAFIRKNKVLKTELPKKMLATKRFPFLFETEIKVGLNFMIQENIVKFEGKKPLSLVGE